MCCKSGGGGVNNLDIDELAKEVAPYVVMLQEHVSGGHPYYKDAIFFLSVALHKGKPLCAVSRGRGGGGVNNLDIDELAKEVAPYVVMLQEHVSGGHPYYKDAIFFLSVALHKGKPLCAVSRGGGVNNLDIDELAKEVAPYMYVVMLQEHVSGGHPYYKDAIFFLSVVLHKGKPLGAVSQRVQKKMM